MAPPPDDDPARGARFARVATANFFFFLTFASFFLLPLHIRALGGSERTIGLVMGMAGLSGLASILFVGALLDRFGRRIFLLGGLGVMALTSAAFLFVRGSRSPRGSTRRRPSPSSSRRPAGAPRPSASSGSRRSGRTRSRRPWARC
jgi:MFS family permease